MSVHTPGPRLYSTIPFKHLGHGAGHGGRKESNVSLNVVPFVDMMTILVTFLLMTFSATGEIIMSQKGLKLPDAVSQQALRKAPIIVVTVDDVSLFGAGSSGKGSDSVGKTREINSDTSMEFKIPELFNRLEIAKNNFELKFADLPDIEKKRCNCPENQYYLEKDGQGGCVVGEPPPAAICPRGLLILQADKGTPVKVINRIVKTANAADYRNVMFAVNSRGRK